MKTTRRERFLLWAWVFLMLFAVTRPRTDAADGDTSPKTGSVDSSYDPDRQVAAFRSTLSSADTLTKAAILATPAFRVGNRTTLMVSARFSNAAATCTIQVAYIYRSGTSDTDTATNYIKGWSAPITLTASSAQKEGSYYEAPDYFLDTERGVTCRILVTTGTSAGTVTFWVGS